MHAAGGRHTTIGRCAAPVAVHAADAAHAVQAVGVRGGAEEMLRVISQVGIHEGLVHLCVCVCVCVRACVCVLIDH